MRTINEIIVHCTATPEGRDVTAADVDRWHKERGWSGIGYHWLVRLDGTVEAGRPEAAVGAHVAGRNRNTIGVVYAGGVDKAMRPKDTRTPAQKAALDKLLRDILKRNPSVAKIAGHRDYAAKACPSFNATAEYKHLLDKPIAKSRTVRGSVVAGGGGVALLADTAAQLTEADGHLSTGTVLGGVIAALIIAGALYALYARWDDAGRPLPDFLDGLFKRTGAWGEGMADISEFTRK